MRVRGRKTWLALSCSCVASMRDPSRAPWSRASVGTTKDCVRRLQVFERRFAGLRCLARLAASRLRAARLAARSRWFRNSRNTLSDPARDFVSLIERSTLMQIVHQRRPPVFPVTCRSLKRASSRTKSSMRRVASASARNANSNSALLDAPTGTARDARGRRAREKVRMRSVITPAGPRPRPARSRPPRASRSASGTAHR